MVDIDRLRARLRLEVGIARAKGRKLELDDGAYFVWADSSCCLLGAVARGRCDYVDVAAQRLGLSRDEATSLESGFMGWNEWTPFSSHPDHQELAALGAEFRSLAAEWRARAFRVAREHGLRMPDEGRLPWEA